MLAAVFAFMGARRPPAAAPRRTAGAALLAAVLAAVALAAAPGAAAVSAPPAGPQEALLELVPEHFRDHIIQARSFLPELLEQAELAASLPAVEPPESIRPEVLLDGVWSYYPIEDGRLAPAPVPQRVPQEFDGPKTAWYAVRFTVPDAMRGRRIYLAFEGVTLYAEVYVNGRFAGAHSGRFTPFEVEITDYVRVGGENLLHVLNASAALAYDPRRRALYYQIGGTTELERVEQMPDAPQSAGIWGSVTLSARRPVHVVDQYLVTSVREGKVTAEVTLANRTGESRRVQVVHRLTPANFEAEDVPAIPPQEVTLVAGEEQVLKVEFPLAGLALWDLESPALYWFTTELVAGGETLDRRSVRVGFREFWIEGPHFVLNGSKVRLMGESGVWPKWDPRPGEETPRPGRPWSRHDRPGVEALYRAYKDVNMTAVRLHYRIASRVEIEVADELGILLIPQSGIWTAAEPYERGGATFFRNLEREFAEWIKRDRNSPAVVFWDVENEILRWGTPYQRPWALRLDEIVARYDRSRIILHSGGGKFGDAARAYSFHMAENYDHILGAWSANPDKPVILGEWWIGRQVHHGGGMLVPYGWSEPELGIDPHHIARRERIEMHRMAGVHTMPFDFDRSFIHPVPPMSEGRVFVDSRAAALYRDAFAPLFAGVKERGTTAVAGERLARTAVVINDTPRDLHVRFTWRLLSGETALDQGEESFALANGDSVEIPIEFTVPDRDEIVLRLEVEAGRYRMANEQRIHVLSPALFEPPAPLEPFLLYDPEGRLRSWFDAQGIPYEALSGLAGLAERAKPALIIGRDGLATLPLSQAEELLRFVEQGGRALVMEQAARLPVSEAWHHPGLRLATRWLPHGLAFWSADIAVPYNVQTLGVPARSKDVLKSRYAAVLRRNHPVAANLPRQLLSHWRHGDGRVVDDAIQIPGGVAAPPAGVTVIAGAVGPHNASLVEAKVGEGFYLINQLEITANLGVDPAATLLFLNMLRYLEPEVVAIQLPPGLVSGTIPVGVAHYAPAGWRFRTLRLWVDGQPALERDEPAPRLEIDGLKLDDGAHRVAVEAVYDTPEGARAFRAEGEVFVANWRRLEDELLPPREGWFGAPIKQLKTESESAGWRFIERDPDRYFGDAHRLAPSAPGEPERLTWRMPRLVRFKVTLYADAALSAGAAGEDGTRALLARVRERLTFSASADGELWSDLPYEVEVVRAAHHGAVRPEAPEGSGAGGSTLEIAVTGEVPRELGAHWFSLRMLSPDEPTDAWQLGRVELWGLR